MPHRESTSPLLTRRRFLQASAAAVTGAALAGLYTWQLEPEWLELVALPLPVRDLPPALRGARLVQLSDVHVGPGVDDAYVRGVFRRVRAREPDIVVYTGDLVSRDLHMFRRAASVYAEMPTGRLGTVGVLGNHDYGLNWAEPEVAARLSGIMRDAGLTVLENDVATVAGLQIVGLGDLWARRFDPARAFARMDPRAPAIALSHNPDTVDLPGWEGFRGWILSGHTHGGQCKPPFLPPPILPVRNKRYTAGRFALSGERQLYINRGVGTVLPVRFNVRPEVTVFRLSGCYRALPTCSTTR